MMGIPMEFPWDPRNQMRLGKNHRTNLRHPLVARILPPSMTNSMTNHVSMNEQCVTRMNILLIQHMYVAKNLSLTHNIMYSNPMIWRICSSHVNDFMLGGWCFKECIWDLRMIWRFLPELFFSAILSSLAGRLLWDNDWRGGGANSKLSF